MNYCDDKLQKGSYSKTSSAVNFVINVYITYLTLIILNTEYMLFNTGFS